MKKLIPLYLFTLFIANNLLAQSLKVADNGSSIRFVIKNFGIKTYGTFTGLKGTIIFNAKALSTSTFNVSVAAKSINTNNSTRDNHLSKTDYFDVEKFETISFNSSKITESSLPNRFFVVGNITIKGISKSVQFGFSAQPITGGYLFEGEFEINRRDFGVGGSSAVLADKLKVFLKVEGKL